jgi:hypothetical protein
MLTLVEETRACGSHLGGIAPAISLINSGGPYDLKKRARIVSTVRDGQKPFTST